MNERIERVTTQLLRVPLGLQMQAYGSDAVMILIASVTDRDGATGTGFTYTLNCGLEAVQTMVDAVVTPLVVGTLTDEWATTRQRVRAKTRRIGPDVVVPALSAVDIAVWDLRSRRARLPLFAFLGRPRSTVSMYGSGRSSNQLELDDVVAGSLSYLDEGLRAVKLRVGARSPKEDAARVATVRGAVGPDVTLMVDANERLSPADALDLSRRLEPLGIDWLEEPFPAEDVRAHACLAAAAPIRVAVGEHLASPARFAEYARERAAAVWQPDAALGGGISGMIEVAALAHEHQIPLAYHSLPELSVHLAMGDPAVTWIEHFPILDPILAEPLQNDGAVATAPDRPGHGILWNADTVGTA